MKILALHGGGDSASGLASQQGMQDLVDALPEFEFVFASTPESGNVWYQDPPGGKGEPTTDPDADLDADLDADQGDQTGDDTGEQLEEPTEEELAAQEAAANEEAA